MLATDLIGCVVCFRFPKKRVGGEADPLHKTKGEIRIVYLSSNGLRFSVERDDTGMLETVTEQDMVLCFNLTFKDAVQQIEKEDQER